VQRLLRWIGWHPDQLVVADNRDVNRYRFVPAAILNHMCLGGVFAWSVFNEPITRMHGVLAPAVSDWTLSQTSVTFSLVMGGFVWGGLVSHYFEPWGPRFTCTLGALSLGAGFALASTALTTHNLQLLYAGGAVWGLSLAWSYVPPVTVLLSWFPDRKGFASGGCILGFGGGYDSCV
jgi:MFS family permease